MIFFPYRAQIKLTKLPVVTIAISLLCLAVYIEQYRNERAIEFEAGVFCTPKVSAEIEPIIERYLTDGKRYYCEFMLVDLYTHPRPYQGLNELTQKMDSPHDEVFREHYWAFERSAPRYLTAQLWQERPSWHVGRMLTSRIAHASWEHVIFNLFFFFAFAATVELIIGPVLFFAVSIALALGIGATNTLTHLGWPYVTVTLGLSGVVAGMLGLFAYFVPWAKIRFFYWFLISAGTVGLPAWLVALWYIGWDLHNHLYQVGGTTNFVSHLAGAALGFTIGLLLFRKKRHWVRELVAEDVDFTQDEPLQRKLAFIVGIPGLFALFLLFFTTGIELLAWIAKNFWVQLLLVAPIAAAVWQMRAGSDTERYRKGMELLNLGGEDKQAFAYLQPLAEKGHPPAQCALGHIYGKKWGVMRNESKALYWYKQASKRGHAEAHYALGTRCDDPAKAAEWYRNAAERGSADAAFSLGFIYETGKGVEADKEEAAKWYHRAGQLFLKADRREDTEMTIASLNGLAPDHPLGVKLQSLMEAKAEIVVKPQGG